MILKVHGKTEENFLDVEAAGLGTRTNLQGLYSLIAMTFFFLMSVREMDLIPEQHSSPLISL